MDDVKIIANIGVNKGGSEDGLLYVGKTTGGTYMGVAIHREDVAGVPTDVPRYYKKSVIESYMATGRILIANDFDIGLLTDNANPAFIVEADADNAWPKIGSVTNINGVKRLHQGEQPYTVKGEGVTAAEIEAVKIPAGTVVTGSAGSSTAGGTVLGGGAIGSAFIPTDFSGLFNNPVKFVQDHALFVGIVLAAIYWFRRKKKKPLWLF